MKIIWSYWKKNSKWFFLYLLFGAVFTVVFVLYNVSPEPVGYAFLLCGAVLAVCLIWDFVKYYRKCRQVEEMGRNVLVKLPLETFPSELTEAYYLDMIERLFEAKQQMESDNGIAKKEMLDYYSLWVHQIKTPIAATRILLQAAEGLAFEQKTELEMELFKIEQYVEMALSYIRMEDMSADLKFQWYSVDEIVRPAVKKYSKLFILKKIKLEYETIDKKVLTDEKWLGFVIEQLLSNALKYTSEGKISIYMDEEKPCVLVIEDSGIGIWKEDLPRVFEKGFTGYNGRTDKKSTGIGLYLCKSIIDELNHRIYISSEVSKGTKVFLNLERDEFLMD